VQIAPTTGNVYFGLGTSSGTLKINTNNTATENDTVTLATRTQDGSASVGTVVGGFNADGSLRFAALMGGSSTDWLTNLKVDSSENVVWSAQDESASFEIRDGSGNLTTVSGGTAIDAVFGSFGSTGALRFARRVSGAGASYIKGFELDATNRVHLSFTSGDAPTIYNPAGTGLLTLENRGGLDSYYLRTNSSGSLLESKSFLGTGSETVGSAIDWIWNRPGQGGLLLNASGVPSFFGFSSSSTTKGFNGEAFSSAGWYLSLPTE